MHITVSFVTVVYPVTAYSYIVVIPFRPLDHLTSSHRLCDRWSVLVTNMPGQQSRCPMPSGHMGLRSFVQASDDCWLSSLD